MLELAVGQQPADRCDRVEARLSETGVAVDGLELPLRLGVHPVGLHLSGARVDRLGDAVRVRGFEHVAGPRGALADVDAQRVARHPDLGSGARQRDQRAVRVEALLDDAHVDDPLGPAERLAGLGDDVRAAQLGAEHDGSQRDGRGQRQHERAVAPPPRGRCGVQAREQRLDRRERRILDHGVGGTQAVHHVVHDCSSIRARASSEPAASAVQPHMERRAAAARRARRPFRRQAFPGGQQQRLAVDRLQLRERVAQL